MTRVLVFTLVKYREERLLVESKTGRATVELNATLPHGSELALTRRGTVIARASSRVAMTGDRSYLDVFHGTPPLVRGSRKAENMIASVSVYLHDGKRCAFSILARSSGLHLGDEISVNVAKGDRTDPSRRPWKIGRWLENITESSREAALRACAAQRTEARIYRMLGETAADAFFEKYGQQDPDVQLRLAAYLVAHKKKTKTKR